MSTKKTFKEYFFDFLVSAVAIIVTIGAGLWIDHSKDKEKERDYMRSMIADLRTDISNCHWVSAQKDAQAGYAATLAISFKDLEAPAKTNDLYYAARLLVPKYAFYIQDGTLQQLKSGGFQLIHEQAIIDTIFSYIRQSLGIADLQTLEDQEKNNYRPVMAKVINGGVLVEMLDTDSYELSPPEDNPVLLSTKKEDLNQVLVSAHLLGRAEHTEAVALRVLSYKAEALIRQIQKEYSL